MNGQTENSLDDGDESGVNAIKETPKRPRVPKKQKKAKKSKLDERSGNPDHADHSDKSGEYDIGYCKPPKENQFKPGQSGNPKGKPKGSKNLKTIFNKEANEKVEVKIGGRKVKKEKRELAIKSLVNKAASGDFKSQTKLIELDMLLNGVADDTAEPKRLSERDQAILAEATKLKITNEEFESQLAQMKRELKKGAKR